VEELSSSPEVTRGQHLVIGSKAAGAAGKLPGGGNTSGSLSRRGKRRRSYRKKTCVRC
jgi:hypothetical protein